MCLGEEHSSTDSEISLSHYDALALLQKAVSRIGLDENDFMDPVAESRALRTAVVDEWLGENSDHNQGFTTVDIRSHAHQYRLNGEFAGDLGELMVMTVANILHIPLLIITNIQNMPVLVMSPY